MSKNPDKTTPATANAGTEQNIAADVDEVMRKYDRESNTRIWSGWRAIIIKVFMVCFAVYCICMTLFSTAMPEIRLPLFMGFIILAGFLNFPASKHHVRPNYLPWYDILLMLVGAACFFYFARNAMTMIRLATRIQPIHVVIGCIGILVLVELCRRCVGLPILVVAGLLVVYAFYNQLSYGASFYKALQNIIYKLFYTTSGVIGTPVSVCYTYIVLFIIFGAFLERTGIANFFISFANRLAGWSSGGPAKVAVISSALCGMVSGSSVGNTVTTGSFTIPMMKKTGYKPEFAGAVEAAASTGGQIMPPIMGAAAFLMAEYIGIPYAQVAVKAILPAILYFTGIFISVHLEAKKLGLNGIPRDQLPKWRLLARDCYLILPLILLVWLVSSGAKTMSHSAAYSILAAIAVGLVNFFMLRLQSAQTRTFRTVGKAALGAAGDSANSVFDSLEAGIFDLSPEMMGLFTGSTVHEVAHVVGAANAMGAEVSNNAIIVKMIRVMMLVPVLLVIAWTVARDVAKRDSLENSDANKPKISIPWFAIFFLVVIGFNSLGLLSESVVAWINQLDTFLLTMAMAALGAETSFDKFKKAGFKPFLLAAILYCWLIGGGYCLVKFAIPYL